MVVEAFFHYADDLRLRGDLSALQALQAEQRDGGNRKRLRGGQGEVQGPLWQQESVLSARLRSHRCHSLE